MRDKALKPLLTNRRQNQNCIGQVGSAVILAVLMSCFSTVTPEKAVAASPTSAPIASDGDTKTDSNLEPDREKYKSDYQEIESLLGEIETNWNAHNLDQVMSFYDNDYVNNDGLNKNAVQELTKDFWKTYPDAKSFSKTKQVRVEGRFATVESRDKAVGSTAKEMPGIGTKGLLTSISEGQLYLRKLGKEWKIIGDRIDYEKVRVAFGLAKDLETSFIAPEQVKSGQEYSARLKVELPSDLIAVGSITSEPLQYPQPPHKDFWRPIENQILERIIHANSSNHNELLMATIGITDKSRSNLKGLTYLTRRLNVVPESKTAPHTPPNTTQTATIEEDQGKGVIIDREPIKLDSGKGTKSTDEKKNSEDKKE